MPVDVSELNRLAFDLGAAGLKATVQARRVIAKTAHDIEGTAKQMAPVDTGAMRNSIGADVRGLSAEIGPTVSYAPYVEFGTSRMAPHAFMGPALDRHTPDFVSAMEKLAAQTLGG